MGDEIIVLLCQDADPARPLRFIIHGMPGVGKSTFCTMIGYDARIRAHFDRVLWIDVDQRADWRQIVRDLYVAVSGKPAPLQRTTTERLVDLLHEEFQDSKILLIFDDIWEMPYLHFLTFGGPGCVMLANSRLGKVVNQFTEQSGGKSIELLCLDEDAACRILDDYVPGISTGQFAQQCRNLVNALEGLPIGVRTAGILLKRHTGKDKVLALLLEELTNPANLLDKDIPSHLHESLAAVKESTRKTLALVFEKPPVKWTARRN